MNFYCATHRLYLIITEKKIYEHKWLMDSPRTISSEKKCQSKFPSEFCRETKRKQRHISVDTQVKTFAISQRF